MLEVDLNTRRATTRLGRSLAEVVQPGALLVLDGPLGAGKTFLVRALCRGLGLPAAEPVTSPTFTLVQDYAPRYRVMHADLYRLSQPREVLELGLEPARREGAVVVVEWGRPFLAELGGDALIIELTPPALDRPRTARISATGSAAERTAEALAVAMSNAKDTALRASARRVI